MKNNTVKALEHALTRLNDLPHKYDDTDFKLIESALREQYWLGRVPMEDRLPSFR
jgi:hypothetical protein